MGQGKFSKKKMKKHTGAAFLLVLLIVFAGCAAVFLGYRIQAKLLSEPPEAPAETETEMQTESLPEPEETEPPRPVPQLSLHVPYLFPLEDGMLHPEVEFTADMLNAALNALAEEDQKLLFPELPKGEEALTGNALGEVLAVFFPDASVPVGEEVLTRSEAVGILNGLLGRADETVRVDESVPGFPDVPPTADNAALLEATVLHTSGDTEWEAVQLKTGIEPGWHIAAGKARYFDENGYPELSGENPEGLQLDECGFYTSGDSQLDGIVTQLLAGFQEENPEADREELLHMGFLYVRDSFKYLRRDAYEAGDTGWEIGDAVTLFTTGKGNCYNYAAAVWALARGLGFDAIAISGGIGGPSGGIYPHGWVRIDFDGEAFYYDAEQEMVIRKDWPGVNLYKISKNDIRVIKLRYREPEPK